MKSTVTNPTLEAALELLRAGISVMPVGRDGLKQPHWPDLDEEWNPDEGKYKRVWHPFQEVAAAEERVRRWFSVRKPPGVAAIGGGVSGGLELIDFDRESDELFPAWLAMVEQRRPGLVSRLCLVRTPRPGWHVWLRCGGMETPTNMKLAMLSAEEYREEKERARAEGRDPEKTLIETRGEGGYALVPGCPPECHETRGTYEYVEGHPRLCQLEDVSFEERDVLIECARALDRAGLDVDGGVEARRQQQRAAGGNRSNGSNGSGGLRPGDDYDRNGPDWAVILEPEGWTLAATCGQERRWRRPGKKRGWSATTGHCSSADGLDLLHVFSDNADPFEAGRSYGKWRAWARLNFGEDFKAAARELARQGYGSPPRGVPLKVQDEAAGAHRQQQRGATAASPPPPPPPLGLPPYRPFPVKHLPPDAREFVEQVAKAMEVEPAYVALPTLATLAGAIGNARALQIKRAWSEPCCLWTLTVGDSGTRKSPAWAAAVQPLREIQYDRHDDYRAELAAWEKEDEDQRGEQPEEPPDLTTSDATVEAMGEIMRNNRRGVLLARDELDGWFQSMTRYRGKQGGSDRAQWLELHRAGPITCHRLTREKGPLRVRRALASITGTIQPAVLAKALDQDAMDAGLGARFVLAMPPRKRRRWTEDDVPEDVEGAYTGLIEKLLGLRMEQPAKGVPYFLVMSREARAAWIEWYEHWAGVQFDSEGAEAACYAKIEGAACRLMLLHQVVSCASYDEPSQGAQVSLHSAQAGIALAEWFAAEAVRVYAMLGESDEDRRSREVEERIRRRGGRITIRELHRSNQRKYRSAADAEQALDVLVKAGRARWVDIPTKRADLPARGVELVVSTNPSCTDEEEPEEEGAE